MSEYMSVKEGVKAYAIALLRPNGPDYGLVEDYCTLAGVPYKNEGRVVREIREKLPKGISMITVDDGDVFKIRAESPEDANEKLEKLEQIILSAVNRQGRREINELNWERLF